jgi:TonB family protein
VAYAEPIYPVEANGIEGEVNLEAVIGQEGRILSVEVRSGDPILAQAALTAVRQWAYRPLKINGIPVEVATDIDVLVKRV